jgi:hypothetical protein
MSDIRKRLAHVRAELLTIGMTVEAGRRKVLPPQPHCVPEMDGAINRAKEYFGLNKGDYDKMIHRSRGAKDKSFVDHFLLGAMAMVLFPRRGKGRPRGATIWTWKKYLDLADAVMEIEEKMLSEQKFGKKDKKRLDAAICRQLGKGGDPSSAFKNYDADHLRQHLPKARREFRQWLHCKAIIERLVKHRATGYENLLEKEAEAAKIKGPTNSLK